MAKTQSLRVNPPEVSDRGELVDYSSIIDNLVGELYQDSHVHDSRDKAPSESDGAVGDIISVASGAASYLYVKTTSGWKRAPLNSPTDSSVIGERYLYATTPPSSAVAAGASNSWKAVASLTLPKGDWDIDIVGAVSGDMTGTRFIVGLSLDNGASDSDIVIGGNGIESPTCSTAVADASIALPGIRRVVSEPTTVYLKVKLVYSTGSPVIYGRMNARRWDY